MNSILFLLFVIVLWARCSFIYKSKKAPAHQYRLLPLPWFWIIFGFRNLFLLCGDVELHPWPKQNTSKKILFIASHSIVARNFTNMVFVKAYNSIHKFNTLVYWKFILIQILYLMIAIWKFQNTILCDHPSNKNMDLFVYTARATGVWGLR